MLPCLTGLDCCLSEEINVIIIVMWRLLMAVTFNMFLNKENIIGCYFSICAISFVAFVCLLHRHRVIFACSVAMFVWL